VYYLEHAYVKHIQKNFDDFEEEAHSLLSPAYNQGLKASHTFNILDSRGFGGVAERARYFGHARRSWHLFPKCVKLYFQKMQLIMKL